MHGQNEPPPGASIARQVQKLGISDFATLRGMARFDRARFVPPNHRDQAEADRAVPIGMEQTISQPFIVGLMTQALELRGSERVLEIGTGSGYQTAILAAMSAEVFTIERHSTLSLRARSVLDGVGMSNIRYRIGDGTLGWPEMAPFERIIVTAAAPSLPPRLFEQLAEDGILIAPIGNHEMQQLSVVRKNQGRAATESILSCRFVKLVGADGWGEV